MQLRFLASLIIFVGSYLPLSLILLVQDFHFDRLDEKLCLPFGEYATNCDLPLQAPEFSISLFGLCFICFLIALAALSTVKPDTPVDIVEAKYVPSELMSYTLPYVVSFMSIDYQETGKFLGLIIFLVWMFLITYKSGQIILNPLLIVFGWRLYELKYTFPGSSTEHVKRALSRTDIKPKTRVEQTSIQDVLIVLEKKNKQE
ncbi:MAG: hypothetical protein JKY55_19000 [Aliivibrio sp.]|uniref:hypothetical protein n=1 Tax=Aliivibrio sp. TaxID=1872443 RepID=UPI001A5DD935|nr:hypothetical protein [Aliivibrio sp.]